MSAPVLYIIIPLILGILLFLLRKRKRLVQGVGITSSLLLGLLGFTLPLGAVISAGDSTLKIPSSLAILGRSLTILDSDRPIVGIIFVFSAMWFIAARIDQDRSNIIAIGMMISGLLVASMAIVPFLYAALIQALIALLGIGILTNRGRKVGTGTLRYLVFQMLGVPFILLTGWVLTVLVLILQMRSYFFRRCCSSFWGLLFGLVFFHLTAGYRCWRMKGTQLLLVSCFPSCHP